MTILWCAEFLGGVNAPYPSSTGTIAYNLVTRLIDRKINIPVADPTVRNHANFITSTGKSLGRIYASYDNRDLKDIIQRIKPDKVVTNDVKIADSVLAIPNNPEIVLIAKNDEISKLYARGITIVSVSEYMHHNLSEMGIDSQYIPLGVDPEIFQKIEKPKKGFIFGCVCRNNYDKNFYRLMDAYRQFNDIYPDAAALGIHTDNGPWDVRVIAKKMGINENTFFGNWPAEQANMSRIYNTLDVHININTREWSALPVLESMSCGTPQIVSDYGILREYADGCGLLVPSVQDYVPGLGDIMAVNTEDVLKAMEAMWLSDTNRKNATDASIKRAKQYTWEKSADMWEKLLTED